MPGEESHSIVELENVTKSYPGHSHVVNRVSLSVPRGRTAVLLGPSGCGKTTTLRMINRLVEPDAGEVRVRGTPIRRQSSETLRRSIGYVIQQAGLFPHWTVAENVATVPRLLGWKRDTIQRRVQEVLELVGLKPTTFGPRKPGQLSGGQQQRVGVARALAGDPDLLLMDEPFGALDPITREELHVEFQRLQRRLHKTVVMVTHDMQEAAKLADRIFLMDRGSVAQSGPIADFLLRPASNFVRDFFAPHRASLLLHSVPLEALLADLKPVANIDGSAVEVDASQVTWNVLGTCLSQTSAGWLRVPEDRYYRAGEVQEVLRKEIGIG